MVLNLTHSRIYGGKIISRHFQLVRISYKELDFHGISRFSAVSSSIILMLGGTIQEPCIQKVTDPTKKNPTLACLESQTYHRNL
jgi:hypothetical protein